MNPIEPYEKSPEELAHINKVAERYWSYPPMEPGFNDPDFDFSAYGADDLRDFFRWVLPKLEQHFDPSDWANNLVGALLDLKWSGISAHNYMRANTPLED